MRGTLHEIFQWHDMHEVLYLLSGVAHAPVRWAYFGVIEKRKIAAQ